MDQPSEDSTPTVAAHPGVRTQCRDCAGYGWAPHPTVALADEWLGVVCPARGCYTCRGTGWWTGFHPPV